MEELIDIVDTTNNIIGKADKKTAHQQGLWHRTVCFLLVDSSKNQIYFQEKNAPSQMHSDDFFVKLNGGHLLAGEDISQGVRELEEETGLSVNNSQIINVGINQTVVDFSDDYKIREFIYFFIVDLKNIPTKIKFIDEEVKCLIGFNPNEAINVILGKTQKLKATIFDEQRSKTMELDKRAFKNFTDDNLYLRIFLTVDRYFKGEPKDRLLL